MDFEKMSYQELLGTKEWNNKRTSIANRDGWMCKHCHNKRIIEGLKFAILISPSYPKWYYTGIEIPTRKHIQFILPKFLNIVEPELFIAYYKDQFERNNVHMLRRIFQVESNKYILEHDELEKEYERIVRNAKWKLFAQGADFQKVGQYLENNGLKSFDSFSKSKTEKVIPINIEEMTWLYSRELNIHHTYYQDKEGYKVRPPWDYPDESLETLCQKCHYDLHSKNLTIHKNYLGRVIGELTTCNRCCGVGFLPEYEDIENGICFKCMGKCFET
jgi:hypothetical protein